jgi:hypothetical protein
MTAGPALRASAAAADADTPAVDDAEADAAASVARELLGAVSGAAGTSASDVTMTGSVPDVSEPGADAVSRRSDSAVFTKRRRISSAEIGGAAFFHNTNSYTGCAQSSSSESSDDPRCAATPCRPSIDRVRVELAPERTSGSDE